MDVITPFEDTKKQRRRRRRLRTISTFPTLLTLGNLLCGFAAIHFCLRAMFAVGANVDDAQVQSGSVLLRELLSERFLGSYLAIGSFLIFAGMFFDMLDGRVARLTRNTSSFGGQLDSLADVVTFGVAPAFLVITIITKYLHLEMSVTPVADDYFGRAVWMTAAVYVSCAALRLARFNVEHAGDESAHRSFRGLPSPGAGAVLASLVLLREHASGLHGDLLVRLLPLITLISGLLMVSRYRYVHIANVYLKGRRPFGQVVMLAFVVIIFLWRPAPALATIVCGYAASGPLTALARRVHLLGPAPVTAETASPAAPDAARKPA
jgi:CDP-diacylglycerol---serine O-phosphatidyltransferase